jgi:hypothetical protein
MEDNMATKTPDAKPIDRINEKIRIYLPLLEDEGEKVDQVETVILNGNTTLIKRGEYVEVPFPIFEVLYHSGRYPNL